MLHSHIPIRQFSSSKILIKLISEFLAALTVDINVTVLPAHAGRVVLCWWGKMATSRSLKEQEHCPVICQVSTGPQTLSTSKLTPDKSSL